LYRQNKTYCLTESLIILLSFSILLILSKWYGVCGTLKKGRMGT
jgi:hypothetical protein